VAKRDVERLIGRAVLDPDFRERLLTDPEAAIREAGLKLTKKEMAQLMAVDRKKAGAVADEMAGLVAQPWS